jgi:hypothetical protein
VEVRFGAKPEASDLQPKRLLSADSVEKVGIARDWGR